MVKQLVFYTDPKIPSGGFADRITGMASLRKLAKYTSVDFKIHFKEPFNFFEVFPDKRVDAEFETDLFLKDKCRVVHFNLIDENFQKNINYLGNELTKNNDIIAFVSINNIKPFAYNILLDSFFSLNYNQSDYDFIERSLLMNFGLEYLAPDYSKFDDAFLNLMPEFEARVLGLQIRVGGANSNWTDPKFLVPDVKSIISKITEISDLFDKIFICSDDLKIKNELIIELSKSFEIFQYENTPLHIDRSASNKQNFISNSIGDHCFLRLCRAGVIIGGGGYGRTAAILSSSPYFRV